MAGARQRAEAVSRIARERNEPWRYFVGLEGGLDILYVQENSGGHDFTRAETRASSKGSGASAPEGKQRLVFLENYAYVTDGSRGAYGQSGSILIPPALAVEVVDKGVELGVAIDAFAGGQGIRDAQGAWGVFTKNLITRQDAFRVAVINAFAPFFNAALYR
jgi:non-canonical (house-cleaning) NTP pyrophosphatase